MNEDEAGTRDSNCSNIISLKRMSSDFREHTLRFDEDLKCRI
jgi:hypothetical protein